VGEVEGVMERTLALIVWVDLEVVGDMPKEFIL
jgi:hypothetical protein